MSSIQQIETLLEEQARRIGTPSPPIIKVPRTEGVLTFEKQMGRDDNKTVELRTGLTREEFDRVLNLLLEEGQPVHRGRKLMDVDIRLVIFLQWLKFGQTYQQLADSFKLKTTRVQTAISDLWNPAIRVLTANLIPLKPYNYVPTRSFDNYPHAVGALDATLIPVLKPLNHQEARKYLSGKHRRYGIRLQVLVAPDGHVIHYGGIIKGSKHDFTLYQRSMLVRDMLETVELANGERISTRRAILADGGYQGIAATYPEAVIPRRRRPHGQLSEEDQRFNSTLSHDRIVVERYFGRLKAYWGIIQKPLRIDKVSLDGLMKILGCLTNLKIEHAPLFADESIYNPYPEFEEEGQSEEEAIISMTNSSRTPNCSRRGRQNEGTNAPMWVKRLSKRKPK